MKKFLLLVAAVFACAMGMAAQQTLTVYDGTTTNSYVPIYGYWCDNYLKCEYVVPATDLADMKNQDIKQLTWYVETALTGSWGNANFQIFMKEVEETTLTTFSGVEGATVVFDGAIDPTGVTELNVELTTPYNYKGGNLLIGVYNTAKGSFKSVSFYGQNVTNASVQGYNSSSLDEVSANDRSFIPKTTFTYGEKLEYDAKVTPAELKFGNLNIGMSNSLNIKIKNNGTNAFTPVLATEAPFSVGEVAEVASDAEVEVPVTFAPTELGEFTGTLTVDCGQAGEFTVALSGTCSNEIALTICDGQDTNAYLPLYGLYYDTEGTRSQMIYPAEMLADVMGGKIIGLKFYTRSTVALSGGELEVSLGETEMTEYALNEGSLEAEATGLTPMLSTSLTGGEYSLEFNFDTPYTYNGGNLALQTLVNEEGNYSSTYFYGTNLEYNAGFYQYTSWSGTNSTSLVKFLPKVTIIYTKDQEEPVEPVYYVVGGFNGWSQETGMVEITEAGATITVEAQDLNNPDDENQEFKIITFDANGRLVWYGGADDNNVGYFELTNQLLGVGITLDSAGANFRLPAAGTYTIKLVEDRSALEGLKMVVTKETVTAIDNIKSDVKGDNNYYNLMGQKMNGNNLPAGIYIHNGKKIIVR